MNCRSLSSPITAANAIVLATAVLSVVLDFLLLLIPATTIDDTTKHDLLYYLS